MFFVTCLSRAVNAAPEFVSNGYCWGNAIGDSTCLAELSKRCVLCNCVTIDAAWFGPCDRLQVMLLAGLMQMGAGAYRGKSLRRWESCTVLKTSLSGVWIGASGSSSINDARECAHGANLCHAYWPGRTEVDLSIFIQLYNLFNKSLALQCLIVIVTMSMSCG